MILNLGYLGQMTKLTELRVKGLTGIKLLPMPSFENLINLTFLVNTTYLLISIENKNIVFYYIFLLVNNLGQGFSQRYMP